MSGIVVFDTNIIIYLSKKLLSADKIFSEDTLYCISVISKMELLGYAFKDTTEEYYIIALINSLYVVPLNNDVVETTIKIRKTNKIKLPDAIVYATAQVMKGKLLTNNIADFKNLEGNVDLFNPLN